MQTVKNKLLHSRQQTHSNFGPVSIYSVCNEQNRHESSESRRLLTNEGQSVKVKIKMNPLRSKYASHATGPEVRDEVL